MLRTRLVAGLTSGFVLSAVFATVLTIARFGDAFVEASRVAPDRPAPVTLRLPHTDLWLPAPSGQGMTHHSLDVTVLRGSIVQEEPVTSLVQAHEDERRPPRTSAIAVQWLVYFLITFTTAAYMRRRGSARAGLLRIQVTLFMLALCSLVGTKLALLFTDLPPYVLPVGLVPLWAALYVDRRAAVTLALMVSVCATSLVRYDPVVLTVYLATTTVATSCLRSRKRPPLLLLTGTLGGLLGGLLYLAAREIFHGVDLHHELRQLFYSGPATSAVGGICAGLLAYLFHAPVAKLLGIVSRSDLLHLSDLEQPLLQRMAERAPGSWEHSRMMANLAEAAAASIGADALLTRVGAYYHDLGKSVQPKYFVENLRRGEVSPHESLPPEISADAIMAHVVEGVRILREGGIPEAVIEFAYTHHGTSVIEFFWHKCKKDGNPQGLTEQAFRYPGMRPRTKETGILMLIDAIEAGARTVDPPNRKKFSELVRRVIFTKLQQGQLDESGLTLSELRTVTNRIIDSLCSAYHSRIRYPWQEAEAPKPAQPTEPKGSEVLAPPPLTQETPTANVPAEQRPTPSLVPGPSQPSSDDASDTGAEAANASVPAQNGAATPPPEPASTEQARSADAPEHAPPPPSSKPNGVGPVPEAPAAPAAGRDAQGTAPGRPSSAQDSQQPTQAQPPTTAGGTSTPANHEQSAGSGTVVENGSTTVESVPGAIVDSALENDPPATPAAPNRADNQRGRNRRVSGTEARKTPMTTVRNARRRRPG